MPYSYFISVSSAVVLSYTKGGGPMRRYKNFINPWAACGRFGQSIANDAKKAGK